MTWAHSVKSVKQTPAPSKAVHLGTVVPSDWHCPSASDAEVVTQKHGVSLESNGTAHRPSKRQCICKKVSQGLPFLSFSNSNMVLKTTWTLLPLASIYTFNLTYSRCTMETTVDFMLGRYKVCLLWSQVRTNSHFCSRSLSNEELMDGVVNVGDSFQPQLCVANFKWDISSYLDLHYRSSRKMGRKNWNKCTSFCPTREGKRF